MPTFTETHQKKCVVQTKRRLRQLLTEHADVEVVGRALELYLRTGAPTADVLTLRPLGALPLTQLVPGALLRSPAGTHELVLAVHSDSRQLHTLRLERPSSPHQPASIVCTCAPYLQEERAPSAAGDVLVATLCEEAARAALLSLVVQAHCERACGYLDDVPPLCCEAHLFLWCATGGLLERRRQAHDGAAARLPLGFRCADWREPDGASELCARAAADSHSSSAAAHSTVSSPTAASSVGAVAGIPIAARDVEQSAEATESSFLSAPQLPPPPSRGALESKRAAAAHKRKSKPGEWRERIFAATNGTLIQAHFRDVDSIHEIKSGDVLTSSPSGVQFMSWVRHFDVVVAVFPHTGHLLYVAKFGECHVRLGIHRFRSGRFALVSYRAADAPTSAARTATDWNNFVHIFTDGIGDQQQRSNADAVPSSSASASSSATSSGDGASQVSEPAASIDGRDSPMKPSADVVQYAFDSLGPCSYNSLYDNCEHFATFAAIGDHRSTQTVVITQYMNEHVVLRKMLLSFMVIYNNGLRLLRKLSGSEGLSAEGGATVEAQ